MKIDGRSLADLVAAAAAQTATGQPLITERKGTFGQPEAALMVDVAIGKLLLRPSPDKQWHLKIAHEKSDRVSIETGPGGLTVRVRPTAQESTVISNVSRPGEDRVFIRQQSVSGGGVSIVNGVVVSGGYSALVEIQLPAGFSYAADLRIDAGDLLLNPENLTFLRLEAKAGTGQIKADLSNAAVATFRASSGAGEIDAHLPKGANCRATLSTGVGDISLTLGHNLAITLTASVGVGDRVVRHSDLAQVSAGNWQSRGGSVRLDIMASSGAGNIRVQ